MEKPKLSIDVDVDELNLILVSLAQHTEYVQNTMLRLKSEGTDKLNKLQSEQNGTKT